MPQVLDALMCSFTCLHRSEEEADVLKAGLKSANMPIGVVLPMAWTCGSYAFEYGDTQTSNLGTRTVSKITMFKRVQTSESSLRSLGLGGPRWT